MRIAGRFNEISWVLLAFLLLNLALVDTLLPFAAFAVFTDAVAHLPVPVMVAVGVAAWVTSGPGVAAAFAAYRDAPSMRFGESSQARDVRLGRVAGIAAIAAPFWSEAEDTRVIRPYFRAYAWLFRRAITVCATFGAVTGVLLVGAVVVLRAHAPGGAALPAALVAIAAYSVLAQVVALAMVVEFPRARLSALVRNSLTLSARAWRASVLGLLLLGVYGFGLLQWPFLMLIFGTSLVLFFVYHAAEAIIRPVRDLIIVEESATAPSPPSSPGGSHHHDRPKRDDT